ncbi:glutathione S-transferase [Aspergillus campestris IBT 28561]|uniref:glutathione transferase n=1 Tax=Aspergillus campestris (strain IBT 28561) TaxID=1392248 RepID=A0A2I1D571_ASPC2|nr:glutathione S-transferase [Aspergillus campestris IBT 28561]PKY05019.1 glutathione S-transferase [Aspergillus campestris IBT 28561]
MSLKPITLYSHASGPNPWKVVTVLEDLQLPYETKYIPFSEVKQEPFISINPNGRVPAIEDPNTGITLWESGAIVEYLVETYDKDHTISFASGTPEYYQAKQWLHFQMSGQGPYFGQFVWFSVYHPEKIQSAQDRYLNEIRRVSGVLNSVLKDREWLVGNKYSFVDAAFVPWYGFVPKLTGDAIDLDKDYPHLKAWLDRLHARPSVAKSIKERAEATATVQR